MFAILNNEAQLEPIEAKVCHWLELFYVLREGFEQHLSVPVSQKIRYGLFLQGK